VTSAAGPHEEWVRPSYDPDLESALLAIVDPCSIATGVPISLVDMGLVVVAERRGTTAVIRLQLTSPMCIQVGIIHTKILEEVGRVPWVDEIDVDIDHQAEWLPSMIDVAATAALRKRRRLDMLPQ
jgi:metal-sulfur cluster biosynthetic enzyme